MSDYPWAKALIGTGIQSVGCVSFGLLIAFTIKPPTPERVREIVLLTAWPGALFFVAGVAVWVYGRVKR
jgi:hypothetical protein